MKKFFLLLIFVINANANTSIINGIPTSDFPAVVKLSLSKNTTQCTATMIRAGVFLTAAHCFGEIANRPPFISNSVYINDILIKNISAEAHPDFLSYTEGMPNNFIHDVAIIKVDKERYSDFLKTISVMNISESQLSINDNVTLVGYGYNLWPFMAEPSGLGIKRVGWNKILKINENGITINGKVIPLDQVDGTQAMLASGDSGGPLISSEGKVIGVASRGERREVDGEFVQISSIYTDIHESSNYAFITK